MTDYVEFKKETKYPSQTFRVSLPAIGPRQTFQWRDGQHRPYNKAFSDGTSASLEITNMPANANSDRNNPNPGWISLRVEETRKDSADRIKTRTISISLGPEAKRELMRYLAESEQPTYRENGTMDPCSQGRFLIASLGYPGSRVTDFNLGNGVVLKIENDDLKKAHGVEK